MDRRSWGCEIEMVGDDVVQRRLFPPALAHAYVPETEEDEAAVKMLLFNGDISWPRRGQSRESLTHLTARARVYTHFTNKMFSRQADHCSVLPCGACGGIVAFR